LRVPAKAVLRFELVSKKWLSIISNISFATRHTHLNPHTISALLLRVSFFSKELPTHKYVSLDGKSLAYFSYDFLDFDPSNNPGCIYVSLSCNGLLLCSKCRWDLPERSQPINYIFNPTTRQFAILPPPPDDGQFFDSIQLVFDPSESSCYRVVCTQFFTSELKIYVYSSETNDWKLCVSQESFNFLPVNFADGVSWNDAVRWISPMGNGFSFLLDKKCLETSPRPPLPENWQEQNFRYFGESDGHLHFIGVLAGNQYPDDLNIGIVSPDTSHDQSTDQSIVVYTMERVFSKWFVKYCLHMNAIVMAYPEITEDEDRFVYCHLSTGITLKGDCRWWGSLVRSYLTTSRTKHSRRFWGFLLSMLPAMLSTTQRHYLVFNGVCVCCCPTSLVILFRASVN
jgi:hypothetical protein